LNVVRTVFSNWKNKKKFLLVAGKFNIGSEKFKQKIAKTWYKKLHKQSLNHKYDLKSISNCDVAYYFQAADIVIVSHKTGLTSGVLAMAGTFNKPIVYPELGNFSEQVDGLIAEKFQPNRPHEALNALQRIEAQITNLNEQRNESWLKRNSWKIHVDKILTSIASMNSIL
jgi:hypothetical protein